MKLSTGSAVNEKASADWPATMVKFFSVGNIMDLAG
jgi:hypothetical protein